MPVFTVFEPDDGAAVHLVTLSGRAPRNDDEIVLGPSTARDLGVSTGDTVSLADGGSATVVGLGLFPSDVHAQFDEGAWVMPDAMERPRGADVRPETATRHRHAGGRALRRSRRPRRADRGAGDSARLDRCRRRSRRSAVELANLHNVRKPPDRAGDLPRCARHDRGRPCPVLLGVPPPARLRRDAVARGHAQRRRAPWSPRRPLSSASPGSSFGVPIGLIAGRAGWQAITDRVPLTFRSPLTVVAVVLVVPVAHCRRQPAGDHPGPAGIEGHACPGAEVGVAGVRAVLYRVFRLLRSRWLATISRHRDSSPWCAPA